MNCIIKVCYKYHEQWYEPRDVRVKVKSSKGDPGSTDLTRDHTLSSDLPLMRFLFISPQQKISSRHTGNETDSEFEVFSKRIAF